MALALWQGVAVGPLKEGGNRLVEPVLRVTRCEWPGDRSPFRVANILRHLIAKRTFAEGGKTPTQVR